MSQNEYFITHRVRCAATAAATITTTAAYYLPACLPACLPAGVMRTHQSSYIKYDVSLCVTAVVAYFGGSTYFKILLQVHARQWANTQHTMHTHTQTIILIECIMYFIWCGTGNSNVCFSIRTNWSDGWLTWLGWLCWYIRSVRVRVWVSANEIHSRTHRNKSKNRLHVMAYR